MSRQFQGRQSLSGQTLHIPGCSTKEGEFKEVGVARTEVGVVLGGAWWMTDSGVESTELVSGGGGGIEGGMAFCKEVVCSKPDCCGTTNITTCI